MNHSLSRRDMLRTTAALSATCLLGPSRPLSAAQIQVDELKVISKQDTLYHGWPTLARRKNGELLLVYSGGREGHVCPFGRVELMRSKDGGRTWSWPQVVLDSAIDDRDAGVVETAQGSLIVTTFTSLAYEPLLAKATSAEGQLAAGWTTEKKARWEAIQARESAEERQQDLGEWSLRSTNGGRTWSSPQPCPVSSPHGPIVLSDGTLFYAGKDLWHGEQKVGVCTSSDDGQTWKWLADIPAREGDDYRQYHELHAVEATNGRLIVHIRNHNKTSHHETLQCESTDGGQTWSQPHSIGVWGFPSHLLKLRDGRLLMSYGHRRAPLGNQARLSSDHGQTWSDPIIISGDGTSGDLGYPSTVELDDGSLVTVWYEKLKERPLAVLRQARWKWMG